ncbi:MAG: hypothetical protein E7Z92_04185 [Cyanobacteria bacterium SIG31]|nr:hypothetical protein [Cyanobacteria bacterium SIG31]
MCKYVVLFLLLLLSINFANAFESKLKMNKPNVIIASHENTRQRVHFPEHCRNCHYPQGNYLSHGNLNALEKYALNKTYRRESDLARLERLENLAFGAVQNGDITSRFMDVENAILSRPKYKTKNSILGNIANYFSGTPTGYTPAIGNSFYNSTMGLPAGLGFSNFGGNFYPAPGYMNQNFEQYSNGPFGGGWGMSNHNYGTGSSVRILD